MNEIEKEVMSLETAKLPIVRYFLRNKKVKYKLAKFKEPQFSGEWIMINSKEGTTFPMIYFEDVLKILTISEMFDLLPKRINEKEGLRHISPHLHIYYDCADNFVCGYQVIGNDEFVIHSTFCDKTPVKALEKLLVWCLEKEYLK